MVSKDDYYRHLSEFSSDETFAALFHDGFIGFVAENQSFTAEFNFPEHSTSPWNVAAVKVVLVEVSDWDWGFDVDNSSVK